MSKLARAALSGGLSCTTNLNERDDETVVVDCKISDEEDSQHHNSNTEGSRNFGSQSMTRGWSGNTGPKGVLLDFKASHGKSGAILGGNSVTHPTTSSFYNSRQPSVSKISMITHSRTISSPSSDSDSSDRGERIQRGSRIVSSTRTGNQLYGSTHTATRLAPISQDPHRLVPRSPIINPIPNSSNSNLNQKYSKGGPSGVKLFGHLREVGVENFIQAVEDEKNDNQTVVLVHLYDPALESCVVLNNHLSNLARAYPRTKFLRALASEVDFFSGRAKSEKANGSMRGGKLRIPSVKDRTSIRRNQTKNSSEENPFVDDFSTRTEEFLEDEGHRKATDSDILPTLIWYRAGQYVGSLAALDTRMPRGGIVRDEQACKDLEIMLTKHGILNTS